MHRPLLILDLDETLIHASHRPLASSPCFEWENYYVYKRPGLHEFLCRVAQFYELAVWSSASDLYVAGIVRLAVGDIVPLQFVWGRSRGVYRRDLRYDEYFYAKDLKKLKKRCRLERMLIVDDDPRKLAKNYGNAIYIEEFNGEPADRELALLGRYLVSIHSRDNFRRVEKRHWREAMLNAPNTSNTSR